MAEAPQQAQFSVEGGVALGEDLVFVGEHDLSFLHQYGAEGLVAVLHCLAGKADGLFHKLFVLCHGGTSHVRF